MQKEEQAKQKQEQADLAEAAAKKAVEEYDAKQTQLQEAALARIGPKLTEVEVDLVARQIKLLKPITFVKDAVLSDEALARKILSQAALALSTCNELLEAQNAPPMRLSIEGHVNNDGPVAPELIALSEVPVLPQYTHARTRVRTHSDARIK